MAIHEVDTICPVCARMSALGHADMTEHPLKYICPKCNGRHYGEPEKEFGKGFKCSKCEETTEYTDWQKIPLGAGERILGPYQSCGSCNEKLGEDKIAVIETNDGTKGEDGRTGRVFFLEPSADFRDAIGGERCIYMEASTLAELRKGAE